MGSKVALGAHRKDDPKMDREGPDSWLHILMQLGYSPDSAKRAVNDLMSWIEEHLTAYPTVYADAEGVLRDFQLP